MLDEDKYEEGKGGEKEVKLGGSRLPFAMYVKTNM